MANLLINSHTNQPAPIDYARDSVNLILNLKSQLAENLIRTHQIIFNKIWNNNDASPELILELLGSEAQDIFLRGSDLIDFILGVHNSRPIAEMNPSEYTPPLPIIFHENGSVTIDKS